MLSTIKELRDFDSITDISEREQKKDYNRVNDRDNNKAH